MNNNVRAFIALGLVCFFWGTTYLVARIGVSGFPALIFMAIRNTTAGILLLTFLTVQNRSFIWGWKEIGLQIIPGLCMVTFGTGIVGWSVTYIPSGLAALICSMIPIFTIAINLLARKTETINWQIVAGMLLGLGGVGLIFKDNLEFVNDPKAFTGIVLAVASCISWCLGGLYTTIYRSTTNAFFNASIQMLAGGIGLFTLSFFAEDWNNLPEMTLRSGLALLYLIIFGSIVALSSYLYAMSRLPSGLVSIYAYINPMVAILLGFIVLGEKITPYTVAAFLVVMSGVFLVNLGYRVEKAKKLETLSRTTS